MAEERRETVVVEGDRGNRSSFGWLVVVAVIAFLILLFFVFGGANLFTGGGTDAETETINVDTPDNVNVQPSTGQ